MNNWHAADKKEVLKELNASEEGLSDKEAPSRIKNYGKNEIKQLSRTSLFNIFFQQFNSIFIFILLAAGIFSLFIRHYVDFVVIFIVILINASIGFFQQYRAEKTISELKSLLVPKVKVFRSGILKEILSTELVPGDILLISEGDKIMADCRLIQVSNLETNEAVLTGESMPVEKISEKINIDLKVADRKNMIYMGTSAVKGSARAIVISTGMDTEFGKIASLVQKIKVEKTPLEKKLDSFSKRIAVIVLAIAALSILIGVLRGENKFEMILAGIALAVSVIPEGLPAVIAITLAFAISRMKKHNALVKKLPAAETLGRTTVICVDKTGTLTEEDMTVVKLYAGKNVFTLNNRSFFFKGREIVPGKIKDLHQLLKIGVMCNNARIEKYPEMKVIGDPTERAFILSADKAGISKKDETESEYRITEYSFSSKRRLMSIIRKSNRTLVSYVKGAPDVVLKKCSRELVNGRPVPLTDRRRKELILSYEEMASESLRVLAFAFRYVPANFSQSTAESNLIFSGFQGIIDPPRKEVGAAIADCESAGIKVKMITGDSIITAEAISNMIGLDGESIDAYELEKLSEQEFHDTVRQKTVFARITPELKLRIVRALKEQREIVAVTGDGVNDVLALKEAHIGVAMGIRGSDVARESSDIVLLDDNFASVVRAVREGRRVYDNMKKSIKFHLAANLHELMLVFVSLLFAFPLPMLPLAILWMNLITDTLPSVALSVEKEEPDIMRRKPKNPEETILSGITSFIITAGIISFIVSFILFFAFYQSDLDKARTIALTTSVFSEFFIVFTCRSEKKTIWELGFFSNKLLVYSVLAAAALQIIAIYSPISVIFGFKALSLSELLLAIGCSSAAFVFFESKKLFFPRKA